MRPKVMREQEPRKSQLRKHLASFHRDEDGSLIIFSLFIFFLMIMVTGMAVDVMRFEATRVRLQGTIDRAVLAAADLDQTQDPTTVVNDYLEKAGALGTLVAPPVVDQGLNYRSVSAVARARLSTYFMKLMGITDLQAPASSTAEERVSNVEISLVLDISSSMLSNRRFTNLKPAARDFVSTVLASNNTNAGGLVTVSMVPYSAVVNPGSAITDQLNVANTHNYSSCLLFPDSAFNSIALDTTRTYDRVAHFDYGASTNTYATPITRPWCYTGTENQIVVHSSSETDLDNAINALAPFGNTAIDLGAKWGMALLDPSTQSIVGNIVGAGPANGRPLDPATNDVLKILVLMTDGENTTEYDLADQYKTDLSEIWVYKQYPTQEWGSVPQSHISLRISDNHTPNNYSDDRFFWLGQYSSNRIHNYPQGFPNYVNLTSESHLPGHGIDHSDVVRHLSWQDVFATWVRTRIYSYIFSEPYQRGYISYSTYAESYYAMTSVVNNYAADARLDTICTAAKSSGTIIYTVAFEASYHGRVTLANCASSPSHYFDVAGTQISQAFSAIASDIRQLKLTQ